jgi:hypothetical protein
LTWRIPIGIEVDGALPVVRWQPADGDRFTEPFFDDTLRRLRRADGGRGGGSTTSVEAWDAPAAAMPSAIILHVSRCGSTLLSRLLATLPENLVLSEARIFDDILCGRRGDPSVTEERRARWLRHAVAAYVASQVVRPARVVLKLDCWHLFEIARLRHACPGVPLLFVYRDPLEVLVSLMRQPSVTLVRGTVTPETLGLTRDARDALSQAELGAAILGAFFREAAAHREHLVPVPYTSLPAFAWTSLPGLSLTPDEIETMRRASEGDAKHPGAAFAPDGPRKRAAAIARIPVPVPTSTTTSPDRTVAAIASR